MFIKNPKTRRKVFLDNSLTDYEDRLFQVEERILKNEQFDTYFKDNASIKNNSQIDSYYNMEKVLENCATYLLRGQYKENGIMTIFNIRNAYTQEIPASCANGNAEDLIYANSNDMSDQKDMTINASKELRPRINSNNKKYNLKKKYINSKTRKLNRLFSTRKINSYKVIQLQKIDEEGKKVTLKNLHGETILDTEPVVIGGHKGLFDLNEKYLSEWVYIDIYNSFSFNGIKHKISKNLKRYEVKNSSIDNDNFTNVSEMEKVLCFYSYDKDKYYFFDENIDNITKYVNIKGYQGGI